MPQHTVIDPNKQRISRNVDKMIAQDAPDEEIEAYLQSEGLQASEPLKPQLGGLLELIVGRQRPNVGLIEGLTGAVGQAATLGISDELTAGAEAFSPSGLVKSIQTGDSPLRRYRTVRDAMREQQEVFSEDHPIASGIANVAGAIPTAAVRLPGLLGQSALAGGSAFGAATGLGTAEGDLGRQVKSTAQGAALGGTLGGAFELLKRPVRHIAGSILTRLNLRPRTNKFGIEGTESVARRFVRNQFERDNITEPSQIPQAFGPAGPTNEIVADVGGAMVKRTLGGLQSLPGKIAGRAKALLEGRTEGQFGRITADIQRILDVPPVDADRMTTALIRQKQLAAKPLYEEAYAYGKVDDPIINKLLENRWFQRAWSKAVGVARDEGVKLPKVYKIKGHRTLSDGTKVPIRVLEEKPNVQALDYVKRELDGIIKRGLANTGKGGLSSTQANAVRKLWTKFVDRLDTIVPAYKAARTKFSSDASAEEALEAGRNILSQSKRLTADEVSTLSDTDREMFLVGAFRAIRDRLASKKFSQDISSVLDNPDLHEQLRQVARSPDEFNELLSLLQREQNMASTAATIQGSRTTPLAAMQAEILGVDPDVFSAVGSLVRGHPVQAGAQGLRSLFSRQNTFPAGQVAEEAGNMLLQPATPQNLQQIFQTRPDPQPILSRLIGAAGGAIASPSLSSNAATAKMEAVNLRAMGLSNADLSAHLSQRYTPDVVAFIIAATPQRVSQ